MRRVICSKFNLFNDLDLDDQNSIFLSTLWKNRIHNKKKKNTDTKLRTKVFNSMFWFAGLFLAQQEVPCTTMCLK